MKIALLTLHRCINYGSYWQARSLLDGLAAMGHAVELLDHRSRRIDIAEWRCALRPHLPGPVERADYPLYGKKVRRFGHALEALPSSAPFDLHAPPPVAGCDAVVVGSDEVWNLHHPWYGARAPLLYGEGIDGPRLVAHACSFGNYPAERGLDAHWTSRLQRFEAISVRDRNAAQLVAQATGTAPPVVLDPCLQFPPAQGPAPGAGERYAAVYGHSFSPGFCRAARHWAWHRGLRLVSIGYRNDWCDEQWLTAGPQEFADFMGGASAVLTDFFHGCVFALRLHKPFACEDTPYRAIKIRHLLADLCCTDRLAGAQSPVWQPGGLLDTAPGPATVQAIEAARGVSDGWLSTALALTARAAAPATERSHAAG